MIKYRLDFAKKYLDDAMELFNKKRFNSSASRAYYASYQAMWAALGDPEEGSLETSCNNKTEKSLAETVTKLVDSLHHKYP